MSVLASMSIKFRLNLALAVVLSLAVTSVMVALLADAGPRLRNEIASSMRVTEAVVRASIESMKDSPHPEEALATLVNGLRNQRHVRVTLAARVPVRGNVIPIERRPGAVLPAWLAKEEAQVVHLPVFVQNRELGTLLIAADGSDEMQEVIETIRSIMFYTGLFALGAYILTSYLIGTSLAPVSQLQTAMRHLEEGDYNVRVAPLGPPEIAGMCGHLNTLASALRRTRFENQRLSTSIVRLQDDERQDLARELHDELGPHLFSLRASGAALTSLIEKGVLDPDRILRDVRSMTGQVDAIQQTNRRVLQRLAPAGLKELGLARALGALVGMWQAEQPATRVHLRISGDIDHEDDTTTLTIYRVVQEGLTNAYRHAGASLINVDVARVEPGTPPDGSPDPSEQIRIAIRDDGEGITEETSAGFGLRGMRERVSALGGTLQFTKPDIGGTCLEALIPLNTAC